MTDKLRAALEPFVKHYEPWMERLADDDNLPVYSRHTMGDLRRARAALAAAPQPVPERETLVEAIREVNDDWIASQSKPSSRPEFIADALLDRAAPQPTPMDREALVEVIRRSNLNEGVWLNDNEPDAIADALLARGLPLPVVPHEPASGETQAPLLITDDTQAAPETMAWAVVDADGRIDPGTVCGRRENAERVALGGDTVRRVAIRVVEGGDE